jgi:phytoene/squalene synthetase
MRVYLCLETRKAVLTMLISLFPANPSKQGEKSDLPARITKAGSKQTYYTIRFLMDRDRMQDAFRAYAYFRWVDDQLDSSTCAVEEKRPIINRQCELLKACINGESPAVVSLEEQMLVDLVGNDTEKDSGLQSYLRNMMNVMAFDVERCGRVITQAELSQYTLWLSKAVTEYMFYFIGHNEPPPQSATRYHAVCGAHVLHMLRDMVGDIELGYFNIPAEVLENGHISLDRLDEQPFRMWVYERVQLAYQYIEAGREYIYRVKNFRCRLAGFSYLARFEWMLRAIEQDQYCLRPEYPERKRLSAGFWMAWSVITSFLNIPWKKYKPAEPVILTDHCEE